MSLLNSIISSSHKIIFTFALLLMVLSMEAQENILWEERKDPKSEELIIVGPCNLRQIDSMNYYPWLKDGASKYQLDLAAIKALNNKMKGYKLVAFGGTWCGDTKDLMPRFYKITQSLNLDDKQLDIHWVDRSKRGLFFETEFYDILYVPTFIIMKGPREVGRIVETISKESLEQELLFIIDKDYNNNK
jgi:thiol-disulfide isomerase/thioredoxin